jgi:hypothetical protein
MDLVGTLGFVEVHESKHQVVLACEQNSLINTYF